MVTDTKIINNPNKACLEMFYRKMRPAEVETLKSIPFNAIGLIQANVASILYYADVVVKASNVYPFEIYGNCPNTITTLAFFGDTSAVATAMKAARKDIEADRGK